jgi:hypothetical protein
MTWAGYINWHGEDEKCYKIVVKKSEGKRSLGSHIVNGRILKRTLKNRVRGCGLDSSGSG